MKKTRVYGLITARAGSRVVPGKNLRKVGGKPLIAWSIEAALSSGVLDRVVLSTEDEEIAEVAREWGAEIPFMRPSELAQDDSSHTDVMLHALRWFEEYDCEGLPTYLFLLQPTSPMRRPEDIANAVGLAKERDAEAVIGVTPAHAHPYWTRRIDDDGCLREFGAWPPMAGYQRRQVLPSAYEINGAIYVLRSRDFLSTHEYLTERAVGYVMPAERSIDVDTEFDMTIADFLLSSRADA